MLLILNTLVHSSILVTAGVYLLIRFNKVLIGSMMDKILLYLSILKMFMSSLMTNFENDLKKIIALSTLSQLGLMMMILSLSLNFLAIFHSLIHAIFKSLLFMCAGIMIHLLNNNQDIRFCGKMNEYIPFTMMSFYISSLALMGFPFFNSILFKSFNYSIYLYNKYKHESIIIKNIITFFYRFLFITFILLYLFWRSKEEEGFFIMKKMN